MKIKEGMLVELQNGYVGKIIKINDGVLTIFMPGEYRNIHIDLETDEAELIKKLRIGIEWLDFGPMLKKLNIQHKPKLDLNLTQQQYDNALKLLWKDPYKSKYKDDPYYQIYATYLEGACARLLSFSIDFPSFKKLLLQKCHYCNSDPYLEFRKGYKYNGIDRVNNNIGYSLDNCVTCCSFCNRAKGKGTDRELRRYINRIIKNNCKP